MYFLVKKGMGVLIKIQLHFCTAQNFRKLHMLIAGDISSFFQKGKKERNSCLFKNDRNRKPFLLFHFYVNMKGYSIKEYFSLK